MPDHSELQHKDIGIALPVVNKGGKGMVSDFNITDRVSVRLAWIIGRRFRNSICQRYLKTLDEGGHFIFDHPKYVGAVFSWRADFLKRHGYPESSGE